MGKKSKRFIDKRRDVLHTFKVVARSQRDPLVADNTAPQAVLQPSVETEVESEQETYGIFFDDDYNYLQHLRGTKEAVNWDDDELEVYTIRRQDPQAGKKELRHKKLLLPSSAFESFIEEPIGMLNKAAPLSGPRPELDPDVVACLDDDYGEVGHEEDICNPNDNDALPDDFVLMLNAEQPIHQFGHSKDNDRELEDYEEGESEDGNKGDEDREMPALEDARIHAFLSSQKFRTYREQQGEEKEGELEDEEERDFSSDFNESEAEDEVASLEGEDGLRTFKPESHFTEYSLSSSVLRRNEGLTILDGCFEDKFMREYQEEQVGALDGEDIEGWVGEESLLFQQALERSRRQIASSEDTEDDRSRIIGWIKDMQNWDTQQDIQDIEVSDDDDDDGGEKWDCESILTTASTLYNHPRTITDPPKRKRIAVDPHTGIPLEHRVGGLTRRNLAHHDNTSSNQAPDDGLIDTQTLITSMSAISVRPPGETSEERRFRKKALKELRRERRLEKKLNRSAFKDEKKRQEKVMQNNKYNYKISLI